MPALPLRTVNDPEVNHSSSQGLTLVHFTRILKKIGGWVSIAESQRSKTVRLLDRNWGARLNAVQTDAALARQGPDR